MATVDAGALARDLTAVVDDAGMVTDPGVTETYAHEWTGRFGRAPLLVVQPASTHQVSATLQVCRQHGCSVVVQGGATGLVGGSVPSRDGQVVLSTRRLQHLGEVDADGFVTVGAGVTIAALHDHAMSAGWDYGVDLASRDSATIGGTVATNAGGVRVVRYGDTRSQVVGLEAVLPDGSVVSRMQGWPKDSSGYDLTRLFVASEGTLGVITAVRVRLVRPLPDDRLTVLMGCHSLEEAVAIARRLGERPSALLAAEFIIGTAMDLVCRAFDLPFPLQRQWPVYLLVETDEEAAAHTVGDAADVVVDRRVWQYRELQSEAAHTRATPGAPVHSLDVAVRLASLDDFVRQLPSLVAPGEVVCFGHLMEGNLHVQVIGGGDDADDVVLRAVADLGGTISSEHGIGVAKTQWLSLTRSAAEIAAMRSLKQALDPTNSLNPDVLFPAL